MGLQRRSTAPGPAPPVRFATRVAGAPPVPLPWSAGAAGLLGLAFDRALPLRTVLGCGNRRVRAVSSGPASPAAAGAAAWRSSGSARAAPALAAAALEVPAGRLRLAPFDARRHDDSAVVALVLLRPAAQTLGGARVEVHRPARLGVDAADGDVDVRGNGRISLRRTRAPT